MIADLPTRMIVIGPRTPSSPSRWASPTSHGCWSASRPWSAGLTLLFEELWERAAALPDLDAADGPRRPAPAPAAAARRRA